MKHKLLLLVVLLTSFLYAQGIEVTGVVSDSNGEPIIGVTVLVQGTQDGTITDFDGNFVLSAPEGAMLQFTYVGYKEVVLPAKAIMSVLMQEDNELLEEVVVTGYTTQRKADLTGAVAVMDMSKPTSEGNANALTSMQGRLPGVQITTDPAPGAGGSTIRVRGMSTINANSPLIVVDGIPTTENLNSLNPADIASIQVLKDASSASIYGSRAANGVIIITTKQASEDRLTVNVGYSATAQTIDKLHTVLNAEQWGQAYWAAMINANMTPWHKYYGFAAEPQLVEFFDKEKTIKTSDTDWQNAVYHTAWTHNTNASVAYSSQKARVYFSGNYIDQEGLMDYTYYKRFSTRINSEFNIGKYVKVGENLMIARWSDNGFGTQDDRGIPYSAMRMHPILPVTLEDGSFSSPLQLLNSDLANPVHQMYNGRDNNSESWRIFGNAFLEINPWLEGLYLKTNIGIEHVQYNSTSYGRKINDSDVNSMSRSFGQGDTWTWSNTLRYENVFGDHHVNALVGTEAIGYTYDGFDASKRGYAFEDKHYMVLGTGEDDPACGGGRSEWALFSIFAKADYNYADRYLVSATLRRDATSRLYKGNNSGIFPAFSAAWRFTEESFYPENKYLTNGKLRIGWGQNGNAAIDNLYSAYSTYAYTTGNAAYDLYSTNNETVAGIIVAATGTTELKWETTTQLNIGLDLGLFNNDLNISADWYLKETKDMLTVPPVLSVAGENAATWQNTGNMKNVGVEVSLDYHSPNYNGFSWAANFNIAHYKNTVTKLNNFVKTIGSDIRLIEGEAMGVYYGYVVDGIFQNQEEVDAHATQQGKGVGRFRYKDLNDDKLIDEKDQMIIGDPNPTVSMGLNIDLKYKGLTLSAFFTSELGFDIYNTTRRQLDFMSYGDAASNRGIGVLDCWSPENTDATIPAVTMVDNNNELRMSTYFVEDGSYCKLKYIKLGYDFPKVVTKAIHAQNLNIFFQVENVFTATKYSGLDPELPLGTYGARVDNGPYPRARNFSMGLNLTF